MRLALYVSERDPVPFATPDVSWGDLLDLLSKSAVTSCGVECPGSSCPLKKGRSWSPVRLKPEGRRRTEDVEAVTALVLDLDHLSEDGLVDAARRLEGWQHAAHTTHSDRPGDRCLRVVVPLSREVPASDWARVRAEAVAALGVPADPATKDLARLYFLPSHPEGTPFLFASGEGRVWEVGAAPVVETPTPAEPAGELGPASPSELAEAARWLAEHGPAVEGKGGDLHTFRAGAFLLHDMALTWDEARPLALAWNRTCEPPWAEAELEAKLRNGLRYASGVLGSARRDLAVAALAAPPDPLPKPADAEPDSGLYAGDLRELLADDSEPDPMSWWLVEGVLAAGVPQVIAGAPKSGKTLIAEHLAVSLAAGGADWLGRFRAKPGRVLLLPMEDDLRETRRRLWRLARGMGRDPRELWETLWVDAQRPFRFDERTDLERMVRTLEARRPDLVLLDSLSCTHRADENDAGEMSVVIDVWRGLCRAFGCSVAVIHHMRKLQRDEDPTADRMRGTSALNAAARHVLCIGRGEGAGEAWVAPTGNLPGLPESFVVRVRDDVDGQARKVIVVEGLGTVDEHRDAALDARLLEVLTAEAPAALSVSKLREATSAGWGRVAARLRALVTAGKVVEVQDGGRGRYGVVQGAR